MTDIVCTENVLGGEPRIEGTRIGVLDVYELVVEGDESPESVADQLNCSLAEVYRALAYYHEQPEAMRSLRRERDQLKERLAEDALESPEPVQ
jgi:uncharacterized protein (DUF433 family)